MLIIIIKRTINNSKSFFSHFSLFNAIVWRHSENVNAHHWKILVANAFNLITNQCERDGKLNFHSHSHSQKEKLCQWVKQNKDIAYIEPSQTQTPENISMYQYRVYENGKYLLQLHSTRSRSFISNTVFSGRSATLPFT